jgi:adenylate cyclase
VNQGRLIREDTREEHPLEGVVILGRSPDCNLQIPDPGVSRRHAMIRQQDDGFWFFDLGSFNGSYVNGTRVTTAQKLESNDVLDISGHAFRFDEESDGESPVTDLLGASTMARVRDVHAILLVTDIQGFSGLSEVLQPGELAPIIGSWYAQTEQIVAAHGATLDKFIGDCAMCYWTDTSIDNRIRAIHAAGALQQACIDTYEAHRHVLEPAGLKFGTGAAIHTGRVAYGGMSSREFTLLGDAVNVTFRVEALTRTLGEPVLTTAEFLKDWEKGPSYCRSLGAHSVKGRKEPVEVYAIDKMPGLPGAE